MRFRISTEVRKGNIIPVFFRHREEKISLLPEGIEVRHLLTQSRSHLPRVVIELADPVHLRASFRIGLFDAKLVSKSGENVVIRFCLPLRFNRLFHSDKTVIGICADIRDVVVFKRRAGGKHDIRVPRCSRPDYIRHDNGIRLFKSSRQLIRIRMVSKRIAACPHHQMKVRERHLFPVIVNCLARMQERV